MIDYILAHIHLAPYLIAALILLAGINIPISIDVVIVLAAFIAGSLVPEKALAFFLAITIASYFSAWLSYWFGRKLGRKVLKIRFFAKMFPEEKLERINKFYSKHGLLVLIIGRFIPFGTRNCIFMTTGMTEVSFSRFALRDLIACPIWASCAFYLWYSLGQNLDTLITYAKTLNIIIFSVFLLTLITLFWYKKRKKYLKHD
ncbi:MAG: Inner membrane protein [Chlamydiia bacterium]|nr:Inner membrane protein [Chlamydiia bacterium]MCH9616484.1 Inner membrane protein [Chlamydiia bacterium]MCH9629530.1 Inner membrane protein [Chlamydiia bacterium]